MWKARAGWICIILASAVLYLFDNGTATLMIMAVCIASPLVSGLLLLLEGSRVSLSVKEADQPESPIEIAVYNRGVFPVSMAELTIRTYNRRTEKERREVLYMNLPAGKKTRCALPDAATHAGIYDIQAGEFAIYDVLHLWKRRLPAGGSAETAVYPRVFDISMDIGSSASSMPESERYSETRGGNDPGEVRSIREYIPGDPVRNIHWKLSEKADKLLVKELGLPVTDQFLVILDTTSGAEFAESALDSVASVFISVMKAFLLEGLEFTAAWTDPEMNRMEMCQVCSEADYDEVRTKILGLPASCQSMIRTLGRDPMQSRYAHVIVAGTDIPEGIGAVANGCRVTLLLYGQAGSAAGADGIRIIGFDDAEYSSELAGIEI